MGCGALVDDSAVDYPDGSIVCGWFLYGPRLPSFEQDDDVAVDFALFNLVGRLHAVALTLLQFDSYFQI